MTGRTLASAPAPAHGAQPLLQKLRHRRRAGSARNPMLPWLIFLAVAVGTSILAIVFAEGRSPVFIGSCWLLALLCAAFVVLYQPHDTLAPPKIASLLYGVSFAYAPPWLVDLGNYRAPYFGINVEQLLASAALIALIGYLCFLAGYFLSLKLRLNTAPRAPQPFHLSVRQRRYTLLCTLGVGLVGGLCYLKLLLGAGGLGLLLNTHTQGRADMFFGVYGGWFWGMHLLFAAYGFAAIALMPRHPWLCLAMAAILGAAFVPFHGRDIIVAPLFCWLLFYHALRKPVRWRTVFIGGLLVVMLSALVGIYRTSGDRIARDRESTLLGTLTGDLGRHFTRVIAFNIEQLDSIMIAVRYVETERRTIGPMVLMSWAEPLDRALLGDRIPSIYTGVFMDRLIIPEHRGWNTALSPSLPGELYIGMGWGGVIAGLFAYGLLFGRLKLWFDNRGAQPILFAAYPFLVYMIAKMIVDGSTHAFRPMIVLGAVLGCALIAPAVRKIRARRAGVAHG